MLLVISLTIASAGGALAVGAKALRDQKKKKEMPWTYHAKKLARRATKRKTVTTPLFTDARQEQLKELFSVGKENVDREISAAEKEINRYLATSSVSLALATAGTLFYPPLALLSLPGLVYGTFPVWQKAYRALFYDKQVKIAILDSIALPGIILTGHFLAAALCYTLYYVSEKLLLKTKDSSIKNLTNVFGEQPRFVWILSDGVEVEIPFERLQVGDIVVVHAGQSIPVDGKIVDGYGSIDQRMLTGESQPAEKGIREPVFASTLLLEGQIGIQVEKAGKETVAANIGEILLRTTDFKAGVQLKGEEIADQSTLPTLFLGALALPIGGHTAALAVLNAAVGENVKLVAPLSVLNFLQLASQAGILIKDGRALELLSQVDTVVFDKTGTLTLEQPHVGAIYTCHGMNENKLLAIAAAAEYKQTHPIARAIREAAQERQLTVPELSEAKYDVGYGLKVRINQQVVLVGSKRFMEMSEVTIPPDIRQRQEDCNEHGYSLVYVAIDDELAGAIELHATIRPEAKPIISQLRQRGFDIVIISGDHEKPTRKLAQELGIEHYFAETLPENKANLIEQLQAEGKAVCFVGDGINDSIALKKANVSISLSGASTIATDTATIILMDGSLNQLDELFELADKLDYNMKGNLVSSILPGVITIGGAFFFHFGILSAIMIYNVGLVAGVANAMWPMISHQRNQHTNKYIKKP